MLCLIRIPISSWGKLILTCGKIPVENLRNLSDLKKQNGLALDLQKAAVPQEHKIYPGIKTFNVCKFSCGSDFNGEKLGRHNYHKDVEKAINKQILKEFNAAYAYLSMACYFARSDIALPGCQGFFMRMHEEEHGHALKFIDLQVIKGGEVHLYPLTVSECQDWESISKALAVALDMEKLVKDNLIELHNIAEQHRDHYLLEFIESEFLSEQDRSINEIARLLKRILSMGKSGLAEYLFDKEMHNVFVKRAAKKGIDVEPCNSLFYK